MINKFSSMKLSGMLEGLKEQMESPQYKKLSFEDRFGLLVDRERNLRQERKEKRRIRVAKFRETAVMEDLDLSPKRGLSKSQRRFGPTGGRITPE